MKLTAETDLELQRLAERYHVSAGAVRTLLVAVAAGGGSMAQFQHPELGGSGQWMRGGMTMVGDLFNNDLRALVANLCADLSSLVSSKQVFETNSRGAEPMSRSSNIWWPGHWGSPGATGGQNDVRYAYFPARRRLAIERAGKLSVYDTLDHEIGGVQQQQGGASGTLSFTSQNGTFTVDSLPLADGDTSAPASNREASETPSVSRTAPATAAVSLTAHEAILTTLERLAELRQKGVLSDDEFAAKKAELLGRL